MQITDILAQLGGVQSMARELGINEGQATSGAAALRHAASKKRVGFIDERSPQVLSCRRPVSGGAIFGCAPGLAPFYGRLWSRENNLADANLFDVAFRSEFVFQFIIGNLHRFGTHGIPQVLFTRRDSQLEQPKEPHRQNQDGHHHLNKGEPFVTGQ